jgi:hypothetical protein
MTRNSKQWSAFMAAAAVALVSGCSDVLTPDMTGLERQLTPSFSSHIADDLFLIDNNCGNSTPGVACASGGPTGSDIFAVNLTGGQAVLSLVKGLHGTCAANSSIDCNTHFNQAHIGVTPDGGQLWAINRNDVGGGGWPAGYVDLTQASRPFTYVGQIQDLGSNGIVMATFSPEGDLMVANQLGNTIYRVSTSTLAVTGSWEVDINLDGADLAYNAAGDLFLYTNDRAFSTTDGDERGLYKITLGALLDGEGTATAVRVGVKPDPLFFTGLAFRAAGTGNLVMSNAVSDVIQEVNPATGAFGATYPFYLNGDPYDHQFGDMASSLRQPPAGATLLIIDEDGIDNGLHVNKSGGWITPSGPQFWTDREVNDDIAAYGLRNILRYFANSANFGRDITVRTGQTGDEGWFAPWCMPAKWLSTGSSSNNTCLEGAARTTAINNYFFNGKTPFPGAPSPTWAIPQSRLDKIPDVRPLRALGIQTLVGKDVCALVYDSDISINYDHNTPLRVNGNLQGATYGIAAFHVVSAHTLNNFSSSTLPQVKIRVLNPAVACQNLQLYNAPVPTSSSVPNDRVVPSSFNSEGSRSYRSIATGNIFQ